LVHVLKPRFIVRPLVKLGRFLPALLPLLATPLGCAAVQAHNLPLPATGAQVAAQAPPRAIIGVREPLGYARSHWPVTTGVPLPRGWLRDAGAATLKEHSGAPVPLQTRVLSRWDDGSVRWLLADFPVTIGAHVHRTFELTAGGAPASAEKAVVRVEESADGVTIDTGPLRFRVPRDHFAILQDVRLHGRAMLAGPLGAFLHTDEKNGPRAPKTIAVRESGPLRAQIELQGELASGFDYVVRLYAYAGEPVVRVLFTIIATGPAMATSVRQIAVQAPLPPEPYRSFRLGIEHAEPAAGRVGKAGVTLIQDDNLGFHLDGRRRGGHAEGWIETAGPQGGVALASRFFWQEYPQGFQLQPTLLTYNLWAPEAPPASIGVGAAKTHEFALYFFSEAPPPELFRALQQPLVATVDPAWIAHSAALPNAVAPDASTRAFLERLDRVFARVQARTAKEEWDEAANVTCPPDGDERRRQGAFGMLNWGDWNYPGFHDTTKGCDAWGNLEYDLAQVDALAFAALGKPEYHEAMTATARHFMDVDVIHAQPSHPQWVGMNHPKNPRHFSFAKGGVDLGHTWVDGLLSYYDFTGDDRALDAARGIADYLVRRPSAGILGGNPRQWGWPQIALLAVYQATGDERYKTAALEYARRGMKAHPPTAIKQWKMGILADALVDTHRITRDPEIEKWLRAYAAAVAAKSPRDLRFYPALAYVARLTNDPKLAQTARQVVDKLPNGSWAKPFTISGRTGFRILSLLGG